MKGKFRETKWGGLKCPTFNPRAEVLRLCLFSHILIALPPAPCCTLRSLVARALLSRGGQNRSGCFFSAVVVVSGVELGGGGQGLHLIVPSDIAVKEPRVPNAPVDGVLGFLGGCVQLASDTAASLLAGWRNKKVLGWLNEHRAGFCLQPLLSQWPPQLWEIASIAPESSKLTQNGTARNRYLRVGGGHPSSITAVARDQAVM